MEEERSEWPRWRFGRLSFDIRVCVDCGNFSLPEKQHLCPGPLWTTPSYEADRDE